MRTPEATAPALEAPPRHAAPAPLRPRHAAAAGTVGVGAAAATLAALGVSGWSVVAAATAVILVWVAAIDLETRLIPNRIVVPATAVLVALAVAIDPLLGVERAVTAVTAGGLLLVLVVVRPGGLGMGDVKLAALLGALLGTAALTALLVAFVLAGLVGLALVVRRGRVALRTQLPLAPFLALGGIVALLLA